MQRWSARVAVCAVAVPLLLAGCSAEHQASRSLPTNTTTAKSSPTLPPLGPADFPVPVEARSKTPAGVQAFTRYYIALMNRQAETLDSQPLRNLSRDCQTCTELANSYDDVKAAGHKFVGGDISVSSTGTAIVNGDEGEISFLLLEQPTKVVDASGAVVDQRSSSATKYSGGLRLGWDTARATWVVTQLDADPL